LELPFVLKDSVFAVKVTLCISVSSRENKCTDATCLSTSAKI